mmetsp:Transcript_17554/g.28415  ORF Transcript_17554/g.28415 Transcript_17554/m.28415 type:complete len:241 (-) Transcript_17554:40-762(-)
MKTGNGVGIVVVAACVVFGQAGSIWVPKDCPSKVLLCYEGDEKYLQHIAKVDIFNPCKEHAEVREGDCRREGYKHCTKDPIFDKAKVCMSLNKNPGGLIDNVMLVNPSSSFQASDENLEPQVVDSDDVCWKKAHYRGVGKFTKNCTGEVSMGLCYPKCAQGEEGIGPMCLANCKDEYSASLGVLCCKTEEDCKGEVKEASEKLILDFGKIVMDRNNIPKLIGDLRKLYEDTQSLDFDECQ